MNNDMIETTSTENLKSQYRTYKELVDKIELEINKRHNEELIKENNEITNSVLGRFAINFFELQPLNKKDEAWYYEVLICNSSVWDWSRPLHSKYLNIAHNKMGKLEKIVISQENVLKVLDIILEK